VAIVLAQSSALAKRSSRALACPSPGAARTLAERSRRLRIGDADGRYRLNAARLFGRQPCML
jgi:hypothetical protein